MSHDAAASSAGYAGASGAPPESIVRRFRPTVGFQSPAAPRRHDGRQVVVLERLERGAADPKHVRRDLLPLLVVPRDFVDPADEDTLPVVVAVEGRDTGMAAQVAALLDPQSCALALVHVTWLPETVSSPLREQQLDNPEPVDLLMYEGATEALVDTADALRAAGFSVTTHLRTDRHPADALVAYVSETRAGFVVLGVGRHGAGIGRELLRDLVVAILYVDARSG